MRNGGSSMEPRLELKMLTRIAKTQTANVPWIPRWLLNTLLWLMSVGVLLGLSTLIRIGWMSRVLGLGVAVLWGAIIGILLLTNHARRQWPFLNAYVDSEKLKSRIKELELANEEPKR